MTLNNDTITIEVNEHGAELASLKKDGREYLWAGDAQYWNRHAPILFPAVGKPYNNELHIEGKTYPMKQHGFARDSEFENLGNGRMRMKECELSASYPYRMGLEVCYHLKDNRLEVYWTVENRDDKDAYFQIGAHPGFLLPPEVRKEDCRLLFPGAETLRYIGTSAAGYALPAVKALPLENGGARYREDVPETWIFEDGQVKRVGIETPDGRPFVMLDCEQFPMLAVWANPKGPFICLEPWFGRTDDEGFTGTIDQKKGMVDLEPGGRKEIAYAIDFL